jgi:hypothetical protein
MIAIIAEIEQIIATMIRSGLLRAMLGTQCMSGKLLKIRSPLTRKIGVHSRMLNFSLRVNSIQSSQGGG